jgi:hypothetical protein
MVGSADPIDAFGAVAAASAATTEQPERPLTVQDSDALAVAGSQRTDTTRSASPRSEGRHRKRVPPRC